MIWLLPIPLVVLFGVVLLWLGLRGRRVDDHPICRKCGFDLFGRPEGSDRCAECGVDLAAPRAIRIGRRERRRGLVASGALLLAIALTLGGAAGYAAYTVTDWQPYKPVWYLHREIDGTDVAARDAAVTELSARMTAGKLPQRHMDATVDRVLAIQGDPAKPWTPLLGNFVEDVRAADKLSTERWQRYARQAPVLELHIASRARRGDAIRFWIRKHPARIGRRTALELSYRNAEWAIDDQRAGVTQRGGISWRMRLDGHGGTATAHIINPEEYAGRIADGRRQLHVRLEGELVEITRSAGGSGRGEAGEAPITSTTIQLVDEFELLPSAQPTVTHR